MAATKPTRGERAKKNAVKRAKPKTNPMDKKPKTTAAKKSAKPKKTAFGYGANEKKAKRSGKG